MGAFYTPPRVHPVMLLQFAVMVAMVQTPPTTSEMNVTFGSQNIGSARITQTFRPDGSKFIQLRMDLQANGNKLTIVQESEYDSLGRPLRKFARQTGVGGGEMVTVTFKEGVASVVSEKDGKRETKKLSVPAGSDYRAQEEFWFSKIKPAIGASIEYVRFDMNAREWVATSVTYRGRETLKINGKNIMTNRVDGTNYQSWVDDSGNPVRLVMGQFILVKKS